MLGTGHFSAAILFAYDWGWAITSEDVMIVYVITLIGLYSIRAIGRYPLRSADG
jgi:hypothetical protein